MHNTKIKTKDGKKYYGTLLYWKPCENYLSIVSYTKKNPDSIELKFSFDDLESAITEGTRISIDKVGSEDEIQRARKYLERGRKYGWKDVPEKKFDWE